MSDNRPPQRHERIWVGVFVNDQTISDNLPWFRKERPGAVPVWITVQWAI